MEKEIKLHPIFEFLKKLMRRYCRRDLKKIKIEIQKPHIPKGKGEPYIFIKRSFMREDVIMKHKEETRFYLETGNIADSYVGAGYQCSSDSACAGGSRLLRKLDEELNHLEVF